MSSVAISASYSAVASTATVGAPLLFDSTGSRDADGDAVTTTWDVTARPADSAATVATSGKTARLNTDLAGTCKVRARRTDPSGAYSETIYPFEAGGTAPRRWAPASRVTISTVALPARIRVSTARASSPAAARIARFTPSSPGRAMWPRR